MIKDNGYKVNYIKLDKNLLLAKGGEQICYIYPNDNTKIVKIIYAKGIHNNQNKLEHIYYEYLYKHKVDLSSIAKCYDYIDTNKGKGLVFERIIYFDSNPSKSFRYLIANKLLPYDLQEKLILELKRYLEINSILFIDTSLTNLFCKKIEDVKKDLNKFLIYYNFNRRHGSLRKELKVRTPFDAVQSWFQMKPEIFKILPNVFQDIVFEMVQRGET